MRIVIIQMVTAMPANVNATLIISMQKIARIMDVSTYSKPLSFFLFLYEYINTSITSLFVHKVAQPTKWRFLPKNLSQPVIFVIGLAFTWVWGDKNLHLVGCATVCGKSEVMLMIVYEYIFRHHTQYGPIKNGRIKNQHSDFEKK